MNKKTILYHGTDYEGAFFISRQGLHGGYNTGGGLRRGRFEEPILFMTPNILTARKYGQFIFQVEVDLNDKKYNHSGEVPDGFDTVFKFYGDNVIFTKDEIELIESPLEDDEDI